MMYPRLASLLALAGIAMSSGLALPAGRSQRLPHVKTEFDFDRIEAAQAKRERKNARRLVSGL